MFETLELQYLNELSEGEVRDFASPEAFHTVKVEGLSGDTVKPSAKVSGKFPMPVSALVGNFTVKSGKFSDGTPPIARTFLLATHSFIECSEFIQGLLQGLRMLYLLTGVQRQIGLESEVYSYTFTCSGQNFFAGVICNNGQPIRSNTVAKDLDIANVPLPIAVVVIQDIATLKHKRLFDGIPFLEGQANRAFGDYRRFPVLAFFKNLVSCLELRRTPPSLAFELRGTYAPPATSVFNPIKEPFVSDMDTDNHFVKRVAGDPHPVFMGPLEQLRQMWLQAVSSGIETIAAVIPFFQSKEVVMQIVKVIEHIAQAFVLRMLAYLIFISSHDVASVQSLTPNEWVGRHETLRLRSLCLPTGRNSITYSQTKVNAFLEKMLWSFPRGRFFLPNLKDWVSKPFN